MIDNRNVLDVKSLNNLTPKLKNFLNETRSKLRGSERRKFMAKVVRLLGKGGQRHAERELGWDRKTIIKGRKEVDSGFDCVDHYSGRGRHPIEEKLPNLLDDIKDIVDPVRASERNTSTILLVLQSVYCVAPASTYPQICTDGCALPDLNKNGRTKLRRNLADLFISKTLRI